MEFSSYAAQPDSELNLLDGALMVARDAYPALDFGEQEGRVEALARPLIAAGVAELPAPAQVVALSAHLNGDCGFRGNKDDYYDPRNSFLNDVLDRGLGIPISLAVIYIEVARRAGLRASGVGFPGHFMVRLEDEREVVILDPFCGGRVMDRPMLESLFRQATKSRAPFDASVLEPTAVRHIVARMLMNLRGIYATRFDHGRLLLVLDRLIDLLPDMSNELRDRGYLWARLGAKAAALEDLERYLEMLPNADDVAEVRRMISKIKSWTGGSELSPLRVHA